MNYPIREVGGTDPEFPPLLNQIPQPPKKLYLRGVSVPSENALLCVIGSRKISTYGKAVCEHLIAGLRGYPISIVSGLALGIDAWAHTKALEAGLHCIAVPGSGIDDSVLYPRAHTRLAASILEAQGTLLSEFDPLFKATEWSFPQRNRIMAGMCHATLLIEAGEKSGTLITARLASDYNRDVLVVPGSIFSENSKGVHQFLKLGATPITHSDDILEALSISARHAETKLSTDATQRSEAEGRILAALTSPKTYDELFEMHIASHQELTAALTMFELEGAVCNRGGTFFLRT